MPLDQISAILEPASPIRLGFIIRGGMGMPARSLTAEARALPFPPIAVDMAIAAEISNPVNLLSTTGGSSCAKAIRALVRASRGGMPTVRSRACPGSCGARRGLQGLGRQSRIWFAFFQAPKLLVRTREGRSSG